MAVIEMGRNAESSLGQEKHSTSEPSSPARTAACARAGAAARLPDSAELFQVFGEQLTQAAESRIFLEIASNVPQGPGHVLDVNRVTAGHGLEAERAERLEVALQGHQIEAAAEFAAGIGGLPFEGQEIGDEVADLPFIEVDVGVAQQRREIVRVRPHARVLEVDDMQRAGTQHQIAAVVVPVADDSWFGGEFGRNRREFLV